MNLHSNVAHSRLRNIEAWQRGRGKRDRRQRERDRERESNISGQQATHILWRGLSQSAKTWSTTEKEADRMTIAPSEGKIGGEKHPNQLNRKHRNSAKNGLKNNNKKNSKKNNIKTTAALIRRIPMAGLLSLDPCFINHSPAIAQTEGQKKISIPWGVGRLDAVIRLKKKMAPALFLMCWIYCMFT